MIETTISQPENCQQKIRGPVPQCQCGTAAAAQRDSTPPRGAPRTYATIAVPSFPSVFRVIEPRGAASPECFEIIPLNLVKFILCRPPSAGESVSRSFRCQSRIRDRLAKCLSTSSSFRTLGIFRTTDEAPGHPRSPRHTEQESQQLFRIKPKCFPPL